MKAAIKLNPTDPIVAQLPFKPYRSAVERVVAQFSPPPGEPQFLQVKTPWGEMLKAESGDYLVGECNNPEDVWPVAQEIFMETYIFTRPGYCAKKALTYLVPLTDVADGDRDQLVMVSTLEGEVTVRAGDFYLARGVKGEIWPIPAEKVGATLAPMEA